jgi:hypothetical protein
VVLDIKRVYLGAKDDTQSLDHDKIIGAASAVCMPSNEKRRCNVSTSTATTVYRFTCIVVWTV